MAGESEAGEDEAQKNQQRRDEDAKERVDRELIELLNELRVAIPGVQVLFAFLLTIPFAQGFVKVTDPQRAVYAAALLCAAMATVLVTVPVLPLGGAVWVPRLWRASTKVAPVGSRSVTTTLVAVSGPRF